MGEEEFWSLTWAQFQALIVQANMDVKRGDFRSGIIASLIYNLFRGKNPAKNPLDFFGYKRREQSAAETKMKIRLFNAERQRTRHDSR